MGCTRSLSKIWAKWFAIVTFLPALLSPSSAWAAFASQFSLSAGEQYNDNIFFRKDKEGDFVTVITPTLSLYYAPTGQGAPTANLNISPSGQIYAHHPELNGFGFTDGSSINGGYSYQYSPRLTFGLSSSFRLQGDTRLPNAENLFFVPSTPTTPIPTSTPIGAPGAPSAPGQNLDNFISRGETFTNSSSFQGSFLYRPDISFSGGFSNTYIKFIQQGGSDWIQEFSIRGIYNWRRGLRTTRS